MKANPLGLGPRRYLEMSPLVCEIVVNLNCFFHDFEKASIWLNTKNPKLGMMSPTHMINIGRGPKVLAFVITAIDENHRELS